MTWQTAVLNATSEQAGAPGWLDRKNHHKIIQNQAYFDELAKDSVISTANTLNIPQF